MKIRVGGVYEDENKDVFVLEASYRTLDEQLVFIATGNRQFDSLGRHCDVSCRRIDAPSLVREIPIDDPKHPVNRFGWAKAATFSLLNNPGVRVSHSVSAPIGECASWDESRKMYAEIQKNCGIQVGDRVRIKRYAKHGERGWQGNWTNWQDQMVGSEGKVISLNDERGLWVQTEDPKGCGWFPCFVLEKLLAEVRGGEFYRTVGGKLCRCVQGEDEGGLPWVAFKRKDGGFDVLSIHPSCLTHLPGRSDWGDEDEECDDRIECKAVVSATSDTFAGDKRFTQTELVVTEVEGRRLAAGTEIELVERNRAAELAVRKTQQSIEQKMAGNRDGSVVPVSVVFLEKWSNDLKTALP